MSQNSSNFETAPSPAGVTGGRAVSWARFDPCRDLRASDAVEVHSDDWIRVR